MARPWALVLDVDRGSDLPPFLQIARALAGDIQRGRLRPGDRLPGSRALAASLDVHRNTVLAAIDELVAEGWLDTTPARGTFVTRNLPDTRGEPFSKRLGVRARARGPAVPPAGRAGAVPAPGASAWDAGLEQRVA